MSEGEFSDDVSGPTAAPETSSGYLPRTPCKIPKTKTQYGMDRYKHYRQVRYYTQKLWLRLLQGVLFLVAECIIVLTFGCKAIFIYSMISGIDSNDIG